MALGAERRIRAQAMRRPADTAGTAADFVRARRRRRAGGMPHVERLMWRDRDRASRPSLATRETVSA